MNRLTFFDSGQGLIGVQLGLISTSALVKYDIYKTYLDHLEKLPIKEARKRTIIKCACGHWDLNRSIWFFQKPRYKKPNRKKQIA